MSREPSAPPPAPAPVAAEPRRRRTANLLDVPGWPEHERLLMALRRRYLLEDFQAMQESLEVAASLPRRTRPIVTHPLSFTLALLRQEADPLGELNAALARIRLGSYGRCESTGAIIPAERLRATPWARHADGPAGGGLPATPSFALR